MERGIPVATFWRRGTGIGHAAVPVLAYYREIGQKITSNGSVPLWVVTYIRNKLNFEKIQDTVV